MHYDNKLIFSLQSTPFPNAKPSSREITLTLETPTPQNGKTHSNNSSTTADKLFDCVFDHLVRWAFKGLM